MNRRLNDSLDQRLSSVERTLARFEFDETLSSLHQRVSSIERAIEQRFPPIENALIRIELLGTSIVTGAHPRRNRALDKASQIQLMLAYQAAAQSGRPLPRFDESELRFFSQNGEDGILLFIFALVGSRSRKCIEICAGDGIECNTANLIVNHGWHGLLVDGSEAIETRGRPFYKDCGETWFWPPEIRQTWVSAENVNPLLKETGFSGEIDLLSLDMDGVDYWVWKALEAVDPRVVVLEYNPALGSDVSWAIPYDPKFVLQHRDEIPGRGWHFGASLRAYTKLAAEKGYRLVGVQRYGFNAFYVKRGVAERELPEVPVEECGRHPAARAGIESFREMRKSFEWVEI